jgi:hypothetical protein
MEITNTRISQNTTGIINGFLSPAILTVSNTPIIGNERGITNQGQLTLINSPVIRNIGRGGVFNFLGSTFVRRNSPIRENTPFDCVFGDGIGPSTPCPP